MAAVSVAVEARKPRQAWIREGAVGAGAAMVVMGSPSAGRRCRGGLSRTRERGG
jgi:hypothetical protein